MNTKIYQINRDRDINNLCFMSYSFTERHGGIDPSIYDLVFDGEVDADGPEEIYTIFNLDQPDGFVGRSMSVSDIIEDDGHFYFCDSIGFEEVEFDTSLVPKEESEDEYYDEPYGIDDDLGFDPYIGCFTYDV